MAIIVNDGRGRAVAVAPTAGGEPRELYRDRQNSDVFLSYTAWTGDSKHVLAQRTLRNGGELWSFPIDGGAPEKSAVNIRLTEAPAVSADGSQIALIAGSYKSEIWVMTGLLKESGKR